MAFSSGTLASVTRWIAAPAILLIPVTAGLLFLGAAPRPQHAASPSPARAAAAGEPFTPILVELFTSEGCSSCPPADALLEKLDRSQPVDHADLIVLSEHVDYWNDLGWKDPFSAHEYSERQSAYAGRFASGSVYTPQMVVDGRIEFVGSDERQALRAIEIAKKEVKVPVRISSLHRSGGDQLTVHVEAGPLPAAGSARPASLLLAIADESDISRVGAGENGGSVLKHVAVLRNLLEIGSVDRSAQFSRDISVHLAVVPQQNLRIVAIVQEAPAGKVFGVGSARLSN